MKSFESFNLSKPLLQAIDDLGFDRPTPIQEQAYPVVLSGKDVVGIAQTGTGKTFAYMLPILQQLKFSKQLEPRVLILLPTRELVMQVVEDIKHYAKYMTVSVLGVYGEANINAQKQALAQGADILVATPGRLYDLVLSKSLSFKAIKKLVIDEVDVMLDLGFRPQLTNILDLLPTRRQNLMFSATMTAEVDALMDDFFIAPARISIAVSGTPLENISQQAYPVKNFFTKVNLLNYLLSDKTVYQKVLIFVSNKKMADRLFVSLEESYGTAMGIIHSNKSQNYRIRAVEEFESGAKRILIATDLMARGLDLEKISHVISFDTPDYPENYMHRIGRTGRAAQQGTTILLYTPGEEAAKAAIEALMAYTIPVLDFPEEVAVSDALSPEEKPRSTGKNYLPDTDLKASGPGFHEKLDKNKKVNLGGSYKRKLAEKYKKPLTRGDKFFNKGNKKK
ncbi:MAG: DEAD/DEAH box helicase [Bacteroidetes bacterium]|nr:DEAD/DEAH box helicase [Bacteroidota bacterium]